MNRLKKLLHKKVRIVSPTQSDLSYGHSPRGEEVELTASEGTVRELTVLLLALVPVLLLFHACHGSGNDTYFSVQGRVCLGMVGGWLLGHVVSPAMQVLLYTVLAPGGFGSVVLLIDRRKHDLRIHCTESLRLWKLRLVLGVSLLLAVFLPLGVGLIAGYLLPCVAGLYALPLRFNDLGRLWRLRLFSGRAYYTENVDGGR